MEVTIVDRDGTDTERAVIKVIHTKENAKEFVPSICRIRAKAASAKRSRKSG